jgi:hypothetical protein
VQVTLKKFIWGTLQVVGMLALVGLGLALELKGVDSKWINMAGMTILLFGLAGYVSRALWRSKWYWPSLLGLLVIHCAAIGAIQAGHPGFPLAYYLLLSPLEAAAIYFVVLKVCE